MSVYDINGNTIATIGDGESAQKSRIITTPNRANPSEFSVGWVNTTVGGSDTLNTSNTGTRTTAAIPVTAGKVVSMGYISSYNHNPFFVATSYTEWCLAYAFFDANGTVVSGATSRPTVTGGVTAPSGAAYVRVTFFTDGGADPTTDPEKFYVCVEDANVTSPTYWFENNTEYLTTGDSQTLEKWGQNWLLFGDSLTDSYGGHGWDMSTSPVGGDGWKDTEDRVPWTGYFWASKIARDHGYTMDNRGESGSNIYVSRVYTAVSGVYILDAFLAELQAGTVEEPDLITIGFGANSVSDEIGTDADTSETTNTLYGGTKYFIEQLNEYCPNARKVYILHPLQTGWRDTNGAAREAMKTVFDEYNVEYVDMSAHSGITTDMLPDGLHISSIEANRQYRRFLESYLF